MGDLGIVITVRFIPPGCSLTTDRGWKYASGNHQYGDQAPSLLIRKLIWENISGLLRRLLNFVEWWEN